MNTTFNTSEMLEKVTTEIRDSYDTCVEWVDAHVDTSNTTNEFRAKAEREINEFQFYCDGVIRTLELLKIDVRVQKYLIGALKERAEKHVEKYL